ncbi:hypothetical protein J2S98_003977 [Arthrobacter oryzae]|nr:hypothetical protein [Arthrobacter oryzae]
MGNGNPLRAARGRHSIPVTGPANKIAGGGPPAIVGWKRHPPRPHGRQGTSRQEIELQSVALQGRRAGTVWRLTQSGVQEPLAFAARTISGHNFCSECEAQPPASGQPQKCRSHRPLESGRCQSTPRRFACIRYALRGRIPAPRCRVRWKPLKQSGGKNAHAQNEAICPPHTSRNFSWKQQFRTRLRNPSGPTASTGSTPAGAFCIASAPSRPATSATRSNTTE